MGIVKVDALGRKGVVIFRCSLWGCGTGHHCTPGDLALVSGAPREMCPGNPRTRMGLADLFLVFRTLTLCVHYMHKSLVALVSACVLDHICISCCPKGKNS